MHEIQQKAREIRQRLMFPPNAVPDKPLALRAGRENGITGRTVENRRLAALVARRRDAIVEAIKQTPRPQPTRIGHLLHTIANDFDMPYEALFSTIRCRPNVQLRQTAMYMLKTLFRLSLPDIGRRLGFDHTTVLHAVKRTQRRIDGNPEFAAYIKGLTDRINGP